MSANGDFSGATTAVSHGDPIAPVIFGVTLILVAVLIGRYLARRTDQPAVLGGLLMGLMLGNMLVWSGYELMLVLREGTAVMDMAEAAFATLFFAAAIALGAKVIRMLWRFDEMEAKIFILFVFVMTLAWGACRVGLAAIIGGLAASVLITIVLMVIVTTFATPPMPKALFRDKGELTEAQSSPMR